jgi:hypothetical protein
MPIAMILIERFTAPEVPNLTIPSALVVVTVLKV